MKFMSFRISELYKYNNYLYKCNKLIIFDDESIRRSNIDYLHITIDHLIKYKNKANESRYYKCYINQLILFIKGLIKLIEGNYTDSKRLFIDAMKATNLNFDIKSIDSCKIITDLEIRILMNLGILECKINNNSLAKLLFQICNQSVKQPELKIYILINQAIFYYKNKDFYKSLNDYVLKALELSKKIQHYEMLPFLFFQKARNEYMLKDESYEHSLYVAKFLAIIFEEESLLTKINEFFVKNQKIRTKILCLKE